MVEDDIQWKTTFGGRRPSVEDDKFNNLIHFTFKQRGLDLLLSYFYFWWPPEGTFLLVEQDLEIFSLRNNLGLICAKLRSA